EPSCVPRAGIERTRARTRRAPSSTATMSPGWTGAAGGTGRPFKVTRPARQRLLARARRLTRRLNCRNLSSRTPPLRQLLGSVRAQGPPAGSGVLLEAREPLTENGAGPAQRLLTVQPQIARKVGHGEEQVAEFPSGLPGIRFFRRCRELGEF